MPQWGEVCYHAGQVECEVGLCWFHDPVFVAFNIGVVSQSLLSYVFSSELEMLMTQESSLQILQCGFSPILQAGQCRFDVLHDAW